MMRAVLRWLGRRHTPAPIENAEQLATFIGESSAFVAQTSLYGYIKTRAGLRYFRMFDDRAFTESVDIAKWNIYAVSVGDLALFCGAHVYGRMPDEAKGGFAAWMEDVVCRALPSPPSESGDDYVRLVDETQQRLAATEWAEIRDDESPFVRSPTALVYWSPIAEHHKQYDEEIVMNSMSFKWKEIRDQFRRRANVSALVATMR